MAHIRALALSEVVRVDAKRVGDLVRELGETAAQNVIGLALEQLAGALTSADDAYQGQDTITAGAHADRLSRLAWQIGLLSLAGVAMDLASCVERRDSVALAAVHARLMRVGNHSLTVIWDRCGMR